MRRLSDGLTLIEVVLTLLLMSIVILGAVLLSGGTMIVFAVLCVSIPIIVISWCLLALLRSVVNASKEDLASPQKIATVPTDFHAALIVEELSRSGIRARAVGDHTFGFQVGSSGHVDVLVTREDLGRAEAIL